MAAGVWAQGSAWAVLSSESGLRESRGSADALGSPGVRVCFGNPSERPGCSFVQ